MKIALTVIFLLALAGTILFVTRFLIYLSDLLNKQEERYSNAKILAMNITMFLSIVLWTILFYLNL